MFHVLLNFLTSIYDQNRIIKAENIIKIQSCLNIVRKIILQAASRHERQELTLARLNIPFEIINVNIQNVIN